MDRLLKKKLRQARWRCTLDILLEQGMWVALGAGVCAVCAVLIERLLGIGMLETWTAGAFLIMAGLLWLVLTWVRRPSSIQVGLLLDERLGLHERLSTVLALCDSDDAFVKCTREETQNILTRMHPAQCIPIRCSSRWWTVAGLWVLCWGLFAWLPQYDLLGYLQRQEQKQQQKARMSQAQEDITQATATVKAAVEKLSQPALTDDLAQLSAALQQADPQAAKRQAIHTLDAMSEKLKQMQADPDRQSLEQLKQMLRQLRGTPQALSPALQQALAQGQFDRAANLLRQLQMQVAAGELSPPDQQALTRQLRDLARQLQQIAQQQQALKNELTRQGLDKQLARLSPEQLRQALEQARLTPEKIEELMQKMAASRMACAQCARLGRAMAAGAQGMEMGDISEAIAALDEMDGFSAQAALSAEALEALRQSIGQLGRGMGRNAFAGVGPAPTEEQQGIGRGTASAYTVPSEEPVEYKKTRAPGKAEPGPVVASWYFQGPSVKGQALRPLEQVVQAAGAQAAEAVEAHRIPRKYERAVKAYFGQLEQQSGKEGDPVPEP